MRDHLTLFINGQLVRVRGEDAFLPLSEFLRRRRGLTGTKVVCAEGDCGSCSVLVGRVHGDTIRYAPITSCIAMMFQLDGTHVVTVEGLGNHTALSPVQEAMVQCHGAQCGFCTPGFVVSLHGLMQDSTCDEQTIRRGLTGNLCRCTGYDSIVQAALQTDRRQVRSLDQQYPSGTLMRTLQDTIQGEVRINAPPRSIYKPVILDQALAYRREHPDCVIVAGATDLGVLQNKRVRSIGSSLVIGAVKGLQSITVSQNHLSIGAAATLSDLETVTKEHLPEFGKYMGWFGSPLIRNGGTIGGNIITGSPIGDIPPVLMVLDAEVELASGSGVRTVSMNAFYTGYRKTVLRADEILTRVLIPLLQPDETLKLYKVSRRKDLDISTFSASIWLKRARDTIADIRIAFGGVGPTVLRMTDAENHLRGQVPTLERFEQAAELARRQVTPITDVRGSREYRRLLSRNALIRFWYDVFQNGNGHDPAPQPQDDLEPELEPFVG